MMDAVSTITKDTVWEYVKANPGVRFNAALDALGIVHAATTTELVDAAGDSEAVKAFAAIINDLKADERILEGYAREFSSLRIIPHTELYAMNEDGNIKKTIFVNVAGTATITVCEERATIYSVKHGRRYSVIISGIENTDIKAFESEWEVNSDDAEAAEKYACGFGDGMAVILKMAG